MSTRQSLATMAVLALLVAACGGGSPTGPSASTGTRAATPSGTGMLVVFTPIGTYTASINGQTFSASGGFTLSLPPGTHEIVGTFRGTALGIGFGSVGSGGAESGSIRSLSGPSPDVRSCSVLYSNFDTPNIARDFRVQFRVTNNVGSTCQAG